MSGSGTGDCARNATADSWAICLACSASGGTTRLTGVGQAFRAPAFIEAYGVTNPVARVLKALDLA